MRSRKEQTRDQAQAEQTRIWQTLLDDYEGVKQKWPERLAAIDLEIDKWHGRRDRLNKQREEADARITEYQGKIAGAARMRREQKNAVLSGKRRTESKLVKAQRLSKELAALTAELHREGITVD